MDRPTVLVTGMSGLIGGALRKHLAARYELRALNRRALEGVACHLSRAQTGGLKGGLGVAEDTSDASIACRQVGPIKITGELKDGERVFDERRSLVFKTLQVVRFLDRQRNVLVYVAYSDRVIEGSPKNSISSIPIMNWPGTQTSAIPREQ